MVNTIHFGLDGDGWSSSQMSDVGSALTTNFVSGWRSLLDTSVTLDELRFYSLDVLNPPPTASVLDGVTVVGDPGNGATADMLPNQDAITVTFRTASRRHWGRIYLGGFVTAVNVDGRVTTSAVDQIAGDWTDILTAWQAISGVAPVVFNRSTLNGAAITAVECDDVWDIQRRRRLATSTHRVVNTL